MLALVTYWLVVAGTCVIGSGSSGMNVFLLGVAGRVSMCGKCNTYTLEKIKITSVWSKLPEIIRDWRVSIWALMTLMI